MKKKVLFLLLGLLSLMVISAQEFDKKVKDAVNNLASRIGRPLDINIGSMTLQGTNEITGFSYYLYEAVKEYADNNVNFNLATRGPRRSNDPQKGIISGTFVQQRNLVQVNLTLISDIDGRSLGPAQRFTFPLAELTERDISIEPVNKNKRQELAEVLKETGIETAKKTETSINTGQTNQKINIQAFFNSESRVFFHRDVLGMSVMADKDCWFKIYQITESNQIKMIYPNESDRNNYLRTNIPRTIFENSNLMIYEPYGAETILIIASTEEFIDIEKEYNAVASVSSVSVRNTINGSSRGSEHEALKKPNLFSAEGQAIYNIYIEKPTDEYEYGRPESIKELYDSIRDDVRKQGGTFTGNDYNPISGYYILNGIRGSFHVPRDKPDKVHFALYNLDNFKNGTRANSQTRGAGHTFSFNKPVNITQAIQTVRTGIEGKGGSFSGNDQQGTFNAVGIAGQYRVSNMVDITITEKPFMIPNSLIEKEVKSFFNVR